MSPTVTPPLADSQPASRPARTRVLPVAQIFSVLAAESLGPEAVVTVIIGDERAPMKRYGLRAPRARWVEILAALAAEDESLAEELRSAVRKPLPLPV